MSRVINFFFLFALCAFAIFTAGPAELWRVGASFLLSAVLVLISHNFSWLTPGGAVSALVAGTVVFGLGGWSEVVLLFTFFVTGTLFMVRENQDKFDGQPSIPARNGVQVWANGFWLTLCVLMEYLTGIAVFSIAGAASIAAATSDTWATELGSRRFRNYNTYSIRNFGPVEPGTDGGVSLPGTVSAIAGSCLMALLYYLCETDSSLAVSIVIALAGFSGCLADSYLGAAFQKSEEQDGQKDSSAPAIQVLDNNMVNWVATGFGAFTALILNSVYL